MNNILKHLKNNWHFYLLGAFVVFIATKPIQNYVDSRYTKEITCTVDSASTDLRSGGSGGKSSSSPTSTIQTQECGQLVFYRTFVTGVGMGDITSQLKEGEKYIFVVNRFDFMHAYPEVQGIKEKNGRPVQFTSS